MGIEGIEAPRSWPWEQDGDATISQETSFPLTGDAFSRKVGRMGDLSLTQALRHSKGKLFFHENPR
jgi:hypothetical protein